MSSLEGMHYFFDAENMFVHSDFSQSIEQSLKAEI